MILLNSANYLPNDPVQHPGRPESSTTPLVKPHNLAPENKPPDEHLIKIHLTGLHRLTA
jgi:hypothetical protein